MCICGAEVTWCVTATGERVPLESYTSPVGDGRYRITGYGKRPWLVEPVAAGDMVSAYPDHRRNCPRAA